MTPQQFYAETLNKVIDYDGAYGAQCVDAFRYWGTMNSVPVPPTPNNYADGYWYSRDALGFNKWFAYINNPAEFRTGDWVIWGRSTMPGGSKSHKSSHIAMYYMGKEYGENQGGDGGFTLKDTVFSDALGALRWKGYESMKIEKGYHHMSWRGINVDIVRATAASGYKLHLISAGDDPYALKDIMEFDSDKLGIVACVNANYFEMATGLHLGCEGDEFGEYFQAPKAAGIISYYISDLGKIGAHDQKDFWLSKEQIQMVCAPYACLIHNGQNVDMHSSSFGSKDLVKNTQTAAMRIDDDWCLAIFSECFPSDVHAFAQECGANELILMDSGGSTQMFECATTGHRRQIRHTSRKLPNVLVLAKDIEAQKPIDDEPTPEPSEPEPEPSEPEPAPVEPEPDKEHAAILPNNVYDFLKVLCTVVLPAVIVLLSSLFDILSLPNGDKIISTLAAINVFIGALIGVSSAQYWKGVNDDN